MKCPECGSSLDTEIQGFAKLVAIKCTGCPWRHETLYVTEVAARDYMVGYDIGEKLARSQDYPSNKPPTETSESKTLPPISVGETWFIKRPDATHVSPVKIEELTQHTALLRSASGFGAGGLSRYKILDIEWVELAEVGR